MAKVTQIDYQNALYDIEDADAQSKISDLQTAVANTYTKTQVDTKLDNYYDKTQTKNRFVRFPVMSTKANYTIKDFGSNATPKTLTKDSFCIITLMNRNGSSPYYVSLTINGTFIINLQSVNYVKHSICIPLKSGDIISCSFEATAKADTFVDVVAFAYE